MTRLSGSLAGRTADDMRSNASASMRCLDETEALAFVDGRVSAEEQEARELHLDECNRCLTLVASLSEGKTADASLATGDGSGSPPASRPVVLTHAGTKVGRYELV